MLRFPLFPRHDARPWLLAGAACLPLLALPVQAQLPSAELTALFPPGAPAGGTVEVDLTGANLDELESLVFSHPGIKAERVMLPKTEFHKAERQNGTKFRVTVDASVPPGLHEARAAGLYGLSTPRAFQVIPAGTAEVADTNANAPDPEKAPELALESVATGRMDANQIDFYRVKLKRGQRVLIHVWAERLDSRADATVLVKDGSGRRLEYNRDTVGRDPLGDFTAPEDGTYWVGVHDFLFLGGAEYPYRLQVTERPWIDYVNPPAGTPGQEQTFTLHGRNLPGGSLDGNLNVDGKALETLQVKIQVPGVAAPSASLPTGRPLRELVPGFDYRFEQAEPVRIGLLTAPLVEEDPKAALQTVAAPCEIAGGFDSADDDDAYRFTAKKDSVWWIEAICDRLSGRADPFLIVEKITRSAEGLESFAALKNQDDLELGTALKTFDAASRDARLTFKADQDGDYRVTLVNRFGSGGPAQRYRLSIREARPDFQLLAVMEQAESDGKIAAPKALLLRQGGTVACQVLIDRQDGLDSPIVLSATGLPPGVSCPPVPVHAGQTSAWLVLKSAPDAAAWTGAFQIVGKTTPPGQPEQTREASAGTLVWGAKDIAKERLRTRLSRQLALSVMAAEKTPVNLAPAEDRVWTVEAGQKLEIPVKLADKGALKGAFAISPEGLAGFAKAPVLSIDEAKDEGKLAFDFAPASYKGQPGTFTFVLKGSGTVKHRANPGAVTLAEEEKKLADTIAPQAATAATQAKAATAAAQKTLDDGVKAAAAAKPEAKAAADQAVAEARTKLDAAKKAQTEAEARNTAAVAAKADAEKRLKAATDRAKEADLKFAAFSLPLTIEVKPAEKK